MRAHASRPRHSFLSSVVSSFGFKTKPNRLTTLVSLQISSTSSFVFYHSHSLTTLSVPSQAKSDVDDSIDGVDRPSEGVVQSSCFSQSRGFPFPLTSDHCLETSFLLSLQQSPFSMAVSQRLLHYPPAAKNHRSTLCNSPPSSWQGKLDFTHLQSPQGF